jgi:capsular polysaccharide export protein
MRAVHDAGYRLAQLANPLMFWHTRGQAELPRDVSYRGGTRRLLGRRQAASRCRALLDDGRPFYLFPLQPDDDRRIRFHSSYAGGWQAVEQVVDSFARFAPERTRLAIVGPVDDMPGHRRRLRKLPVETDIGDRLVFLPGGNLSTLIDHASGLVTINGSEGLTALESECPTLALGNAIYRMPGLTSPSSLDDFWRHPIGPDKRLFRSFARVVIHATQINGGFFSREGIDLAVINAVSHLTENVSPIERLLWDSRLPVAS